jgi:hypothetical protein
MSKENCENIQDNMSELYSQLKSGEVKREDAAELANIAGKWLKARALDLAERQFDCYLDERQQRALPLNEVRQITKDDIFPVN